METVTRTATGGAVLHATPMRELATATDDERRDLARVAESLVINGDLSLLTPEESTRHYLMVCQRLRLDPTTSPLLRITLNGRSILYPTRGATDQLAAAWGVDRNLTEKPHVVDTGAGKIIQASCVATWRGRTDESTGSVPVPAHGGEALCNALLKAETKCKRRATLSILGLGMLAEEEVESAQSEARASGSAIIDVAEMREASASPLLAVLYGQLSVRDDLGAPELDTIDLVAGVYDDVASQTDDTAIRSAAHRACVAHLEGPCGQKKIRVKFKKATDAAELIRAAAKRAQHAPPVVAAVAQPAEPASQPEPAPPAAPTAAAVTVPPAISALCADVAALTAAVPGPYAALWLRHKAAVGKLGDTDRVTAWGVVWRRLAERANATEKWARAALKVALVAQDVPDATKPADGAQATEPSELPPIPQHVRFYELAHAISELEAIDADVASMKLPVDSPGRRDLAAARAAAVERLAPVEPEPEGFDAQSIAVRATLEYEDGVELSPESARALDAAVERLKATNGPPHLVRHFAAHVDELPTNVRGEYRAFAELFCAGRYPAAVGTRERAAKALDDALAARDANGQATAPKAVP